MDVDTSHHIILIYKFGIIDVIGKTLYVLFEYNYNEAINIDFNLWHNTYETYQTCQCVSNLYIADSTLI